ncbi:MAG: hypothetical protein AAGG02_17710 [Cyanobacteria bacterium P01_H01_bin.15]
MSNQVDRVAASGAIIVVASALIYAFWVLGSPQKQRQIRLDEERLREIHQIAEQLVSQQDAPNDSSDLPETLPNNLLDFKDPITNTPYEYRRLDDERFELCADFATNQDNASPSRQRRHSFWQHPAGPHCFEFDITTDIPRFYSW